MALRKVALLGGALSLLLSQAAMSVGLGDIKLNSSLNEPLDAEIQLLNVGDLSELEILVGLAGREDFERAGVAREFFLTGLRFTVERSSGQPVIRVRSSKPVREPYLDFLVELQWPTGRMLREYTLLVDLPVYANKDSGVAAKKSQPKSVEVATGTATARTPREQRSTQSAVSSPALSGKGEYHVNSGDTLWQIAENIRPEGASVYQTMVAIERLNPSAFIDGNINLLKRGVVLRLPDPRKIVDIRHRDAVSEVTTYRQPNKNGDGGALLDASDESYTRSDRTAAPEGRLKLSVADNTNAGSAMGDASALESAGQSDLGSGQPGREVLENELAIAEEESVRKDRVIADQTERIAKLEEQLSTMQRMLEIRDSEMRAVQLAQEAVVDETVDDNAQMVDDKIAENEQEVLPANVVAQKQSVSPSADSSFWGEYKYYLMGGGAALVLLLFFIARNRNDNYSNDSESFDIDDHVEPMIAVPTASSSSEETMAALREVELSDDDQLFADVDDQSQAPESFDDSDEVDEADDDRISGDNGEDESTFFNADESRDDSEISAETSELATEQAAADTPDFSLDLDLDDTDSEEPVAKSADSRTDNEHDQDDELALDFAQSANDGADLGADVDINVDTDNNTLSRNVEDDLSSGGEFDLLSEDDEVSTKLDLAQAYLDMGDSEGARDILQEVIDEGDSEQQEKAQKLMESIT